MAQGRHGGEGYNPRMRLWKRLLACALASSVAVPAPAANFRAQAPRVSVTPGVSAAPVLQLPAVSLGVPTLQPLAPLAAPVMSPALAPSIGIGAPIVAPAAEAPQALPFAAAAPFADFSAPKADAPGESASAEAGRVFDNASKKEGSDAVEASGAAAKGPALQPSAPQPSQASVQPRSSWSERQPRRASWRRSPVWRFLAKATGIHAFWAIYRDGVLMQRALGRLTDPASDVADRVAAARILAVLGRPEPITALSHAAQSDPEPRVQRAAANALRRLGEAWTPRLSRTLRFHPFSGSRQEAARQLGHIARHGESMAAVESLGTAAASDRSVEVRLQAVESLAAAKHQRVNAILEWVVERSEEPRVRSAAVAALARTGLAPEVSRPVHGGLEEAKRPVYINALKWTLGVGLTFFAVDIVGAILTGSLALRADATHMAVDLSVTAAALVAAWISRRPPSSKRTYGFLKIEPIVGLLSAVIIGFTAVELGLAAWARLSAPVVVPGLSTILFAFAGLLSNAISTLLLFKHRDSTLSLKGAFLHAAMDALGSVGIILAGLAMIFFGWAWADPIISFGIVALILKTTFELGKRAMHVLLDGVPEGMDLQALETELGALPGAAGVYDLHVWSLNSTDTVATAAIWVKPGADPVAVMRAAQALLREKGVKHATIQAEPLPAK